MQRIALLSTDVFPDLCEQLAGRRELVAEPASASPLSGVVLSLFMALPR
ncbi:hypothetical protein [Nonomuraea sp. NPDC050540]